MPETIFSDIRGSSVFISGGGSGIGAALTSGFLAQGANVAFADIADCEAFVDEMTKLHARAPLFLKTDITDTAALKDCIETARTAHGPVRILVNNAANDERYTLAQTTPEIWDDMMAVNLKAYFFACQAVVAGMREQGGGAIINFSSISYMMGLPDLTAYTAANGAITAMTRSLARELGGANIRVNAIAPGWVLTDRQKQRWATKEGLANHFARQCLPRHMVPADLVEPVMFLSSDASRMMTGQCMVVDGGVVTTG